MGRERKIEEQRALYTRAKQRGSANPDLVALNRKRQRTGSDSTPTVKVISFPPEYEIRGLKRR